MHYLPFRVGREKNKKDKNNENIPRSSLIISSQRKKIFIHQTYDFKT